MHVFMSYRRHDGISYFLADFKKLIDHKFGIGTAFFDIDDIPIGRDFREHLTTHLDKASIVLVFIGDRWLGEELDGSRRIDSDTDFVRFEIATALKKSIPVVPIFTERATANKLENLPADIAQLKYRNGLELRSGPDQKAQTEKILKKLEDFASAGKPQSDLTKVKQPANRSGDQSDLSAEPLSEFAPVDFQIVLAKTYYRTGMVNPGPAASAVLGNHGDEIDVLFGGSGLQIKSKINRTANVNKTVRLIGKNAEIADWFQANYKLGETVACRVVGRTKLILSVESVHRQII